jgi:cytochrome bd ubiquinol oxidase subunit I
MTSLIVFCAVYAFIFSFGVFYIHQLLRAGPEGSLARAPAAAVPNRPMSVVDEPITATSPHLGLGE